MNINAENGKQLSYALFARKKRLFLTSWWFFSNGYGKKNHPFDYF
jgi:hypothetical protein